MLEQPPITSEKKSRSYFEQTASSKEFLAAKKFLESYVDTGKFTIELSESNIDAIRQEIDRLGKRLMPGAETDGIIAELRNAKEIAPAVKKQKEEAAPEVWKAIAEYKLNVVGKVDLEEIQKTPVIEARPESIFTNKAIDELHEQALRVLGNEEIDQVYVEKLLQDFIHIYNIDTIEADIRSMVEKEAYFKQADSPERARLKKIATILEAILVEGIAKYDWLGKKIKILPPSKFDELCRGVDAIVELAQDDEVNEFLALGIDVSYRAVEGDLFEEKIERLLKDIDEQHLTQLKYFKDNQGNAMEGMYVPKVVVSVDGKTAENLVSLWERRKTDEGKTEFKNATIAVDIIGQIAEQCKLFAAYARTKGVEEIATKYDEAFELLLKISEEVPQAREAISRFTKSKFVDKIEEIIKNRKSPGGKLRAA